MQHTHFGSATHGAATFLSLLVFGTVWRLGWMHALRSRRPTLRRFGRVALLQY